MTRATPVRTLAVVRLALLAGVLTFGAVTWFLHRSGGAPAPDPAAMSTLRPVGLVVWAVAVIAVLFVRLRLDALARRGSAGGGGAVADTAALRLIAWAAGEAAALYGVVVYFLTADPRWYVYGLTLMLAAFVLVPVRQRA